MPGAFHHRHAALLVGALALALALFAQVRAGAGAAQASVTSAEAQRETRPAPGSGRRGFVSVPAWVVWSAGGVLVAAAARSLHRLAQGGGRS
jgi:hypothetical protein